MTSILRSNSGVHQQDEPGFADEGDDGDEDEGVQEEGDEDGDVGNEEPQRRMRRRRTATAVEGGDGARSTMAGGWFGRW
ncbi:hypothetical protein U1Q18_009199 [Sarracenia purpurea var. burkii]